MTEHAVSLAWRWTAETSSDGTHRFCRIRVTAPPGELGDPDAWAVVGLVRGAIDDMLKKLALQPVLHAAAGARLLWCDHATSCALSLVAGRTGQAVDLMRHGAVCRCAGRLRRPGCDGPSTTH